MIISKMSTILTIQQIFFKPIHTQIHRERTCKGIMIRKIYVDVAVESSLQEKMLIVYLRFLISLQMKDLHVYTFTKEKI